MKGRENSFTTANGLKMHTIAWLPEGDPRAIILHAHGLAEHSGRYQHVAARLTDAGYAFYSLDQRAHGKSEGQPRAYFDRFSDFVDDFAHYMRQVMEMHPGKKIFVYGHSMGSQIALSLALRHQDELSGLLVSAAPLDLASALPPILVFLSSAMSALAPQLSIRTLDSGMMSRDPAAVKAYDEDPLNYRGKLRARAGHEILKNANEIVARASELRLPMFIIHGGGDQLVPPSGSEKLHERASSDDKTLKMYPGLYHEIHNEPEQEEVLTDIVNWLDQRA